MSSQGALSTSQGIGRLWLFSAYALFLLTANVMHFEGTTDAVVIVATCVLWLVLLVDYVRQTMLAEDRSRFLRQSLAYPLYLISIIFVTAHNPWIIAVPLIVGFVMQLRRVAAGHASVFALGLAAFTVVMATVGIVYAERNEPDSPLRDIGSAATWSLARILQLRGFDGGNPLSEDGEALSFIIAIAGLLVAALLTAQLVSWVVGGRHDGNTARTSETAPASEAARASDTERTTP